MIKNPLDIIFELTLHCNLHCNICSRQHLKNKTSEMDFQTFTKLVTNLEASTRSANVKLNIGGYGEPLIYPQIIDAIRHIKEKFPQNRLVLTTNGHLLVDGMTELLLKSGLDYLRISLNACTEEEYRRLMNNGYFAIVKGNVYNFLTLKNKINPGMTAGIQILHTKSNDIHFSKLKSELQPHFGEKDFFVLRCIENRGGKVDSLRISQGLAPSTIVRRWPCHALWHQIAFDVLGRAYACCEAYTFRETDTNLLIGDINKDSIADILCSPCRVRLEEQHLSGDYSRLPECLNCTKPINYPNLWVWQNNRWRNRDEDTPG